MKVIIQKVSESRVVVEGNVVGEINKGLLVLVGFCNEDTESIIVKMIDKIINLRIFEDEMNKMNLSLQDVKGSILSISQFTLYADCKKGRRPSFINAASGTVAEPLYNYFNKLIVNEGINLQQGIFGSDMKVSLTNDGPCTIVLDSEDFF